jgi:hypothetical protein
LADSLSRQRELFNARFAAARCSCSNLDATAFLEHLANTLDPIVRKVADMLPEKVDPVSLALYELSLELFVARLMGPEAKTPWVASVWRELLPAAASLVAREPGRLAACASNAILNLAGTPGTRPQQWLARMIAVATLCPNATTLLDCGKTLAWQAGMSQYREGGIEAARALPPPLATKVLDLPDGTSADDVHRAIERVKAEPWLSCRDALTRVDSKRVVSLVAKAGAFRGFGGPFICPPTVSCDAGAIYASDGEGTWQLLADAYGQVFVRCQPRSTWLGGSGDHAIGNRGDVRWGSDRALLPQLANPRSQAANDHTLAVTLSTSHHVFLLARVAEN